MDIILHILSRNILPLFALILLGFVLDKRFNLNINTLTKINFYLFVPSFIFVSIYQTAIALDALKAMLVTLLILISNMLLCHILAKVRHYDKGMKSAFQNTVMFYNSGNMGIPVITLVFSSGAYMVGEHAPYLSLALTTQIMVLVIQNIGSNTFGFFIAGRANRHWQAALLNILKMPTIYMVTLAFLLKLVPFDVTTLPIWPIFEYARGGLVPVALVTLGVQLSKSKIQMDNRTVYLAVFTRLIIGPLLALGFILLLQIDGIVAQVLLISAAVPTAVNVALIAVECDNHPGFSTQAVIASTMISSVTLTGVIYAAARLFPI